MIAVDSKGIEITTGSRARMRLRSGATVVGTVIQVTAGDTTIQGKLEAEPDTSENIFGMPNSAVTILEN